MKIPYQDVTQQQGVIANAVMPETTNVPPAPSNTMGNARPVFSQLAQENAAKMYGNISMRQNACGTPPVFKKKCNKKKY